jgi:hypothetical protein
MFGQKKTIMIRNSLTAIFVCALSALRVFGLEADIPMLRLDAVSCSGGYRPNSTWLKESTVQWEADSKILPLSPSDAILKARNEFNRHLKDYMEMRIEADKVRLNQVEGFWCYTIALSFRRRDLTLVGVPFWACVHVRMDGVARVEATPLVTPEPAGLLRDRDKKTSEQTDTRKTASRSQSKSEGSDKPQPEAEGRSR